MARTAEEASLLEKGGGMFLDLSRKLGMAVRERGGKNGDLYRLVIPEGAETIGHIADLIIMAGDGNPIYVVDVNYSQPFEEAMSSNWELDNRCAIQGSNCNIIRHPSVPVFGIERSKVRLFSYPHPVSRDWVVAKLGAFGYRPAGCRDVINTVNQKLSPALSSDVVALGDLFIPMELSCSEPFVFCFKGFYSDGTGSPHTKSYGFIVATLLPANTLFAGVKIE